jgi:MFS family permease
MVVGKRARESTLWQSRKVLLCCALISLCNGQYGIVPLSDWLISGFDTATIGGLQAMPGFLAVYGFHDPKSVTGYIITTKVQQLIASLLTVGSIAGCLTTGIFAQRFGRKSALWFGCFVGYVAMAIQLGSTSLAGLYAGRVILGFSNAYFITFSNVFISEIAPHHLRAILCFLRVLGHVLDRYWKRCRFLSPRECCRNYLTEYPSRVTSSFQL